MYSVGYLDYYEYEPLSTSAQRLGVLSEELSILESCCLACFRPINWEIQSWKS